MDDENATEEPDVLWHYTSVETLSVMLGAHDRCPTPHTLSVWLGHADSLNDPRERRLVFDEYEKRVTLLDPEIHYMLNLPDRDNEVRFATAPFVLSLSKNPDNLLLWSLYAQGLTGVAIGFKRADLLAAARRQWSDKSMRRFEVAQVDYTDAELKRRVSRIVDYVKWDLDSAKQVPFPSAGTERVGDRAFSDLTEFAANYKTPGWAQEEEWRLVGICNVPPGEATDPGSTDHVQHGWEWFENRPHITLNLEVDEVIHNIVLAPKCDEANVRKLLADHQLLVPVEPSPTIVR